MTRTPRPLTAGALGLVLGAAPAHGQQSGPPPAVRNTVIVAGRATGPAFGADLERKRLKITGRWVERHLEASRVEPRDPGKGSGGGRVAGQIDALGRAPRTLLVGPLVVEWTDSTRLIGLTAEKLVPGASIEARGQLTAPAHLLADVIQAIEPGPAVIVGVVTAEERRADGSIALTVLGVEVVVPVGVPTHRTELAQRLDEKRPETQLTTSLFGRLLTIGGELRNRTQYKRHFDLDEEEKLDVNNRLQLEALYVISPHVLAFLSGRFIYAPSFELDSGERKDSKEAQRREHWLFVGDILQRVLGPGYSLQIGRQKFQEVREWWWYQNLDAVRFYYDRPQVHLEVAVAEELAPFSTATRFIAPESEGVLRNLGNAAWAWMEGQRLDFFYLYHFDHSGQHSIGQVVAKEHNDKSDATLLWLGTRASGQVDWGALGYLVYGVDGIWLGGDETLFKFKDVEPTGERLSSRSKHDVGGFAVDARGTWATTAPMRPALTLGYAFGSGDSNARHELDTGFRQTDLQRNRDRFLSIDRFRYYGELVRPELANLHIFTASLDYHFLRSSSVELVYHFYRQAVPAPFLRSARIEDPTGKSSVIGHEWDLALGLEEWEHFEFELIPALFRAGRAYGARSGNLAEGLFLKLKYKF